MSNSSVGYSKTMNQVIKTSDIDEILKYYDDFNGVEALSNGHSPSLDAKIKWSGILEAARKYCDKPISLIDAGCGPSNLSIAFQGIFPTLERIYCFDIEQISPRLRSSEICVCVQSDFFDACRNHVPDNSVDIIIDSCSVTHFDTSSKVAPNDGCYRLALEATRVLKPGGVYITCSDFSIGGNKMGEFVGVESMIESYKKGGLELIDNNFSFDLKDAFISFHPLNLGIVRLIFVKN